MREAIDRWRTLRASWKERSSGIVTIAHDTPDGYHELVSWGSIVRSHSLTACRYPTWRWHLLVCNNPDCNGQVWIREDRYVEVIQQYVVGECAP